jgi:hypothetical protein
MNLKNSLLSLVLAGISIVAGCGTPTQEYLARTIAPNPFRWELLNANPPRNEESIRNYLNNAITYGREKGEVWMSPKVSVTRGYGDCDCRGFLGGYLAGKLGYPRKIIAVAEKGAEEFDGGHVFTLLEKQEKGKTKYGLLDNATLFYPEFVSVSDLLRTLNAHYKETDPKHKLWNYYKIIDLDSSCPKDWTTTKENLYRESIIFGGYVRVE